MSFFDESGEDITVPVGELAKLTPERCHRKCKSCGKPHASNWRHAYKPASGKRKLPVTRAAAALKRLRDGHAEVVQAKQVLPEPVLLQHGSLVVKTRAPWAWKAGRGGVLKSAGA